MGTLSEEAAQIVEALPPDKAKALIEYARYLAETADREHWDRQFSDPRYEQKLQQMAEQARDEFRTGATAPLDPDEL
jgi:hypothetical protein